MKIPIIHGHIDRRILINFTAEPTAVEKIIPFPFRPLIYKGRAIVGICLIRLKNIRPKGLPEFMGINSENGAHRIAVEWDENGKTKTGRNGNYHIDFISSDGTETLIDAVETKTFSNKSIFETLQEASNFFKSGELGYSPNKNKYEGLRLKTYNWEVRPLEVLNVKSSFFENEKVFPKGSLTFDNALLMTNIEHEWKKEV
ncbi:hypothetical protein [Pedobacter nutrimenti]|uniref:hypothetical protein n=1 Tax=Pedobacter nutrimenti TaxID=1241337 RepID=UPI0029316F78|nr:hypothetical protein [Pedobacter nutrimenti]